MRLFITLLTIDLSPKIQSWGLVPSSLVCIAQVLAVLGV